MQWSGAFVCTLFLLRWSHLFGRVRYIWGVRCIRGGGGGVMPVGNQRRSNHLPHKWSTTVGWWRHFTAISSPNTPPHSGAGLGGAKVGGGVSSRAGVARVGSTCLDDAGVERCGTTGYVTVPSIYGRSTQTGLVAVAATLGVGDVGWVPWACVPAKR